MSELPRPTLETRRVVDLIPNPLQGVYFSRRSSEALQELAEIIRRNYFEPIDITPLNVILSGHQRRLAARDYLNMDVVPVRIRHDLHFLGPEAEEQFFVDANMASRQLTKLELVRAFLHRADLEKSRRREKGRCKDEDQGRVRDAIAARFGKKRKALEPLIPILDTPLEIQKAFERGQLTITACRRIAAASQEEQAAIVEHMKKDLPAKKAMEEVLGRNKRDPMDDDLERLWRELINKSQSLLAHPDCIAHIMSRQKRRLRFFLELADKVREMNAVEPASPAASESLVDMTPPPSQSEAPRKPKLLPKPKAKLRPKPALKPKPVLRPKLLPRVNDTPTSAS